MRTMHDAALFGKLMGMHALIERRSRHKLLLLRLESFRSSRVDAAGLVRLQAFDDERHRCRDIARLQAGTSGVRRICDALEGKTISTEHGPRSRKQRDRTRPGGLPEQGRAKRRSARSGAHSAPVAELRMENCAVPFMRITH